MVKIPYVINFWGKKGREFEGEERETREEREKVRVRAGSSVFIFFTSSSMLEHRGPRSSVAEFRILPIAILGAC